MKSLLGRKWIRVGMYSNTLMMLILVVCYWIFNMELREVFMYLGIVLLITMVLFMVEVVVVEIKGEK